MLRAKRGHAERRGVKTEIDYRVAPGNDGVKIIADIDLTHDLEARKPGCAREKRLPHAPFGTGDDDFRLCIHSGEFFRRMFGRPTSVCNRTTETKDAGERGQLLLEKLTDSIVERVPFRQCAVGPLR